MPIGDRTPLIEAALDEAVIAIESALNSAHPRPHWHHGVERVRRKVQAWRQLRDEEIQSRLDSAGDGGQAQLPARTDLSDLRPQAGC